MANIVIRVKGGANLKGLTKQLASMIERMTGNKVSSTISDFRVNTESVQDIQSRLMKRKG